MFPYGCMPLLSLSFPLLYSLLLFTITDFSNYSWFNFLIPTELAKPFPPRFLKNANQTFQYTKFLLVRNWKFQCSSYFADNRLLLHRITLYLVFYCCLRQSSTCILHKITFNELNDLKFSMISKSWLLCTKSSVFVKMSQMIQKCKETLFPSFVVGFVTAYTSLWIIWRKESLPVWSLWILQKYFEIPSNCSLWSRQNFQSCFQHLTDLFLNGKFFNSVLCFWWFNLNG